MEFDIQDIPPLFAGQVSPISLNFDYTYQDPNYENVSPPNDEDAHVTTVGDELYGGYIERHADKIEQRAL